MDGTDGIAIVALVMRVENLTLRGNNTCLYRCRTSIYAKPCRTLIGRGVPLCCGGCLMPLGKSFQFLWTCKKGRNGLEVMKVGERGQLMYDVVDIHLSGTLV